jgi:galactose-3-O-sulfotransferase
VNVDHSGDEVARADERPTVIFLHIGKTAGMTLRMILNRHFAPSDIMVLRNRDLTPRAHRLRREETVRHFAHLPESDRRRARLIEGHTIFGLHEVVPRPSTYITLLRNPIALTISQYNFVARKPRHWLHEDVAATDMTLDAYVRSGISLETDNSQTRALSGDTNTPFGACSEQMLEIAKSNVEKHFSVVGLTERFDETLLLLRRAFGWSKLYYVQANVAPNRSPRDSIPPSTLRRIENQNELDMELYRWARQRFDEAIATHHGFSDELRRFRRGNALYRPWGHLTYTMPRRMYARSKTGGRVHSGS